MRAELRGFYSSHLPDPNVESFKPGDPENFSLEATAVVGPNEQGGDDEFRLIVCSARWLAERPPEKGFWFLQGYLLLTRWDVTVLERAVSDLCLHSEGETWQEVTEKLSRY